LQFIKCTNIAAGAAQLANCILLHALYSHHSCASANTNFISLLNKLAQCRRRWRCRGCSRIS